MQGQPIQSIINACAGPDPAEIKVTRRVKVLPADTCPDPAETKVRIRWGCRLEALTAGAYRRYPRLVWKAFMPPHRGTMPCARTAPTSSPSQVSRPVQGLRPHAPRGLPLGPSGGGAVAPAPPPVLVQDHKLRVPAAGESPPARPQTGGMRAWARGVHACMGSWRAWILVCGVH